MKQGVSKTATMGRIERTILQLAYDEPELGQAAVANRLQEQGLQISASGVRYLWQKHDLETTVKRLQAITDRHAGDANVLTENQRRLLERALVSSRLAHSEQYQCTAENHPEPVERRQMLLEVAAELFADKGYDRTSMRDIAGNAGLLPGSLYHYFTSKNELYMAVHQAGFKAVIAQVQGVLDEDADPWENLNRALTVHVACLVGESGSPVIRLTGHSLAATSHPDLLPLVRDERNAYEDLIHSLIEALPLAEQVDPSLLRLTLLGAMNWVYIWYQQGKYTPAEIVERILNMLRHGVV